MVNNKAVKRIGYIDAMRGFTMIFVVYCHVLIFGFGSDSIGYNDVISKFRMPLFFFISGWVFYKSSRIWNVETVKTIIWKKFLVQIIPFLVFMFLFLYVFDLMNLSSFGNDKSGYWFTFVLFEFFLLYIAVVRIFQRRADTTKGELFIFIVVALISLASFYYAKIYYRYSDFLGLSKVFLGLLSFVKWRYFVYFWLGTFIRKFFCKYVEWTDNQYVMALMVSIFVLLTVFSPIYSISVVEVFAYFLTAVCGIFVVMSFFRRKAEWFDKEKYFGRCLQYIGRRTLDIYVLHYFFLPRNIEEIGHVLNVYDNNIVVFFVGLFFSLLIIVFCLVVSEFIRLSPFLGHYLFGVKRESE